MLLNSATDLAADASIALAGKLDDGSGKLGFNSSADADERLFVHRVHSVHGATATA